MDQSPNPDFLDDITGALDWWREAGVDCDFSDEPISWLAPPEQEGASDPAAERRPRPPVADVDAPPPTPKIDPTTLPQDLEEFKQWWMREPLLGEGNISGRISPHGHIQPEIMILIEEPELQDRDSLLSGPQGKLLDAILHAFGMNRDTIYLASALPRHTPGADWDMVASLGLGQVIKHHIQIVQPKRLMTFGGNILPLIGHELPHRPAVLRIFNHEERSIPLLASWALPALLGQPRAKPVLWKAWLEWTKA